VLTTSPPFIDNGDYFSFDEQEPFDILYGERLVGFLDIYSQSYGGQKQTPICFVMNTFLKTSFRAFLNESNSENRFNDIIYGDNFNIFRNMIKSYHGRIKDGLIVRFYLKEFLKYYDEDELNNIRSWDRFIESVHTIWDKKRTPNQEIVFRRGEKGSEMFFSNNIYVASVYSGPLNAHLLDFKKPYILDCKDSNWMDIDEPEIMKGKSYDGKVSTDNIVDFIKDEKLDYDGIVLLNLYEGSGAGVFGSSTIYISLNEDNIVNLTNN
jgi:hypothetical protein